MPGQRTTPMLRINENTSSSGAKAYYSTADYYSQGHESVGQWRGEAAQRLGLSGEVSKREWDALCDNQDPATGAKLTVRQKEPRRIGWDFNFHVPKSVSILYAMSEDERILDAFRQSVDETMADLEAEVNTRVRKGGKNDSRVTGNMVWGQFVHFTARPIDGVPDPHLHAHCFAFNTTWDNEESRWKAADIGAIKRDAPYFEAAFHSRLARRMEEMGLPVERTRHGWELAGFTKSTLDKFSRRTTAIEGEANRRGITDPDRKGELGAKTRQRKSKELTPAQLEEQWRSRLDSEERSRLATLTGRIGSEAKREDDRAAGDAVRYAALHWFERNSVVPERRLTAEALKHSYGKASLDAVKQAVARENFVWGQRDGEKLVTTREVLGEEGRMLAFARQGRGACEPLGKGTDYQFKRDYLNAGQKRSVRHVLSSKDRVIIVRGVAGTGKTTMMQEAVEGIEAEGRRVFPFAPSADASRGVLREKGFASADTVARLLKDPKIQEQARGQVLWIDEAGLLGTKTTGQLFDLASQLDARIVLSGDRRQHDSVERGAALRLLETQAGLAPSELKEIMRQRGDYKRAVEALSEGRIEEGYKVLDRLKWIREIPDADRYALMARDYLAAVDQGQTVLAISPTHREGERITQAVRSGLRNSGKLGKSERVLSTLENLNLTLAERQDPCNYRPGDHLVFHQNAKGFQKGQSVVVGTDPLPLDQAERFQLFRPMDLPVSAGDRIRITKNGVAADGKAKLNNGAIFTITGFTSKDDLRTDMNVVIPRNYGHIKHGYVMTSHASQGKSVDRVLIGQSQESFRASSKKQLYVSVSRGETQATIYTDHKAGLLDATRQSGDRLSATELVLDRDRQERAAAVQRLAALSQSRDRTDRSRDRNHERIAV